MTESIGSISSPIRFTPGRISLSNSTRLGKSEVPILLSPVALPPERPGLATRPQREKYKPALVHQITFLSHGSRGVAGTCMPSPVAGAAWARRPSPESRQADVIQPYYN